MPAPILYKIWYKEKGTHNYTKGVYFQTEQQFDDWKANRYGVLKEKYEITIYKLNPKTTKFDEIELKLD